MQFRAVSWRLIKNYLRRFKMANYVCEVCGYVYEPEAGDPDNGIDPGTSFDALPDDWTCPICGAGKEDFAEE